MKKKRKCLRCGFEEGSEPVIGCYIGIPQIKINKYHKYKPFKKIIK